jgi:hypothetical protein
VTSRDAGIVGDITSAGFMILTETSCNSEYGRVTAADLPAPRPAGLHAPPSGAQLRERFAPVFARIAAGAVERERRRVLPREEVVWLRDAGLTAIRVPAELGGSGASLVQLFELLIDLAAADSNLPQSLGDYLINGQPPRIGRQVGIAPSLHATAPPAHAARQDEEPS